MIYIATSAQTLTISLFTSRKSRDEKQFEKELQQALEMSKSQSPGVIQILDDDDDDNNENGLRKLENAAEGNSKAEKLSLHGSGIFCLKFIKSWPGVLHACYVLRCYVMNQRMFGSSTHFQKQKKGNFILKFRRYILDL